MLKKYFGHSEFRAGQAEIIDTILSGRDALGIMPTGAGKSMCYQIPALLFQGITLVISPLISLMKDQVGSLVQSGVKAAYINSSLSFHQHYEALRRASVGAYKIVYVAPERLLLDEFLDFASNTEISMVAVDEAHCVSQWGQDFRPSYLKIVEFIKRLPRRPIISAFTATATQEVREDVIKILHLHEPFTITTGFDRMNLHFSVQRPQSKFDALLAFLTRNRGKSGIVYCATRKNVEEVCERLNRSGCSAARYHAGLEDRERQDNQDDFIYDRKPIMVATNAFGMGIDKSNVAFVVHYNMPKNIESYYQEAGRAGRDGSEAECLLFYSGQDVRINRFMIENSNDNSELSGEMREAVRQKELERLKAMTVYCTTQQCLREYILRYFGEASPNYCGKCSNCDTNFETADITMEAQNIIVCVLQLSGRGRLYGKNMVADIVHGSKNERLLRAGLDTLSTYGVMANVALNRIYDIISKLLLDGYLISTEDEYPVLNVTDKAEEVLYNRVDISMKLEKTAAPKEKEPKQRSQNDGVFAVLRDVRKKLAAVAGVPAYVIFTDATLQAISQAMPTTLEEFSQISGVGNAKLDRYGQIFIDEIQRYIAEKNGKMERQEDEVWTDADDVQLSEAFRGKRKPRKTFY